MANRICWMLAFPMIALSGCETAPALESPAPAYRDLDRDGRIDVYEDARRSVQERVDDLLSHMTLEEKVGSLLHGNLPAVDSPFGASDKGYDIEAVTAAVNVRHVSSFITRLTMKPAEFARMNNAVQAIAERSRLGIPVTISSDPRNHFQAVAGASNAAAGFSVWPEPLGFGALGSTSTVRAFGRIAAREYRAVGIHMALSPQADLASEPRWPRIAGTFGADPTRVSALAGAYVQGFQGRSSGLASDGVAAVAKHWVGYGAAPAGADSHSFYGRDVRLDDASFAQHRAAFAGAFRAGVAAAMPTYAIVRRGGPAEQPPPAVGAGFDRVLIEHVLRGQERFDGLVVSDWGIVNDCPEACSAPTAEAPQTVFAIGMPWGVEDLSVEDRIASAVNAGVDQIGGLDDPSAVMAAARSGKIPLHRVDQAVGRVLEVKFRLGLFDNPYVDPSSAAKVVGNPAFQRQADRVQREAQVLLENRRALLPLRPALRRAWVWGVSPEAVRKAGFELVESIDQADFAIVRLKTPSEQLHPHHFFARYQSEGRLDFRDGDTGYEALKIASGKVPVVVAVDMDRPAILENVQDKATALLALFGASDEALLDVIAGRASAKGRLPLNLPSSMERVEAQDPARPDDDVDPLYKRGYRFGDQRPAERRTFVGKRSR